MAELKATENWPVVWLMCAGVEAAENYRLHRPYRAWVRPIRHAAGAQPPHSEDGDEGHHFGELSPSFLQQTPRPPASCTAAIKSCLKHSAARQG